MLHYLVCLIAFTLFSQVQVGSADYVCPSNSKFLTTTNGLARICVPGPLPCPAGYICALSPNQVRLSERICCETTDAIWQESSQTVSPSLSVGECLKEPVGCTPGGGPNACPTGYNCIINKQSAAPAQPQVATSGTALCCRAETQQASFGSPGWVCPINAQFFLTPNGSPRPCSPNFDCPVGYICAEATSQRGFICCVTTAAIPKASSQSVTPQLALGDCLMPWPICIPGGPNTCPAGLNCTHNSPQAVASGRALCCRSQAQQVSFGSVHYVCPRNEQFLANGMPFVCIPGSTLCPSGYICAEATDQRGLFCCNTRAAIPKTPVNNTATTHNMLGCLHNTELYGPDGLVLCTLDSVNACPTPYDCVGFSGRPGGFCCKTGRTPAQQRPGPAPLACPNGEYSVGNCSLTKVCPTGLTCLRMAFGEPCCRMPPQPNQQQLNSDRSDRCPNNAPPFMINAGSSQNFTIPCMVSQQCPINYECTTIYNGKSICCPATKNPPAENSDRSDRCPNNASPFMVQGSSAPLTCVPGLPMVCPIGYYCAFVSSQRGFICCEGTGAIPTQQPPRPATSICQYSNENCFLTKVCPWGFTCEATATGHHCCSTQIQSYQRQQDSDRCPNNAPPFMINAGSSQNSTIQCVTSQQCPINYECTMIYNGKSICCPATQNPPAENHTLNVCQQLGLGDIYLVNGRSPDCSSSECPVDHICVNGQCCRNVTDSVKPLNLAVCPRGRLAVPQVDGQPMRCDIDNMPQSWMCPPSFSCRKGYSNNYYCCQSC